MGDNESPVFKVERGCPADPMGCGCTGQCHELIDVVHAQDYFTVLGQRDELRCIVNNLRDFVNDDYGRHLRRAADHIAASRVANAQPESRHE